MTTPLHDEIVTLWRCRRCGKWSHAKRDPIAHKPKRPDDEGIFRAEWCGPFDRWLASLDLDFNYSPREDLPHAGEPCDREETA